MNKKDDEVFDLMMAFPKYRRIKKRHEIALKKNKDMKKNWEEQVIINENLKDRLKDKDRLIYKLRKKIKELEK